MSPAGRTASGLGMPDGGMLSGAPLAGSVSDTNAPQQPGGFSAPTGLGTDPNQVSTKPRQMPGGGGQAGPGPGGEPGGGEPFDPKANGSEGGPNSTQPDDNTPPSQKATSARIVAMMDAVQVDNPTVTRRAAYLLAKEAITTYPIVVTADDSGWNALSFGDRGQPGDGVLHRRIDDYNSKPLKRWFGDTFRDIRQHTRTPEPAPAHRQPPNGRMLEEPKPAEGTIVDPHAIPSGLHQRSLPPGMDNGKVIPGTVIEGKRLAEALSLLDV